MATAVTTTKPASRTHLSLSELFIAAVAGHIVKHAQSLTVSETAKEVRKDRYDVDELK
jgi:hypothetical protein